jgi:hypothetical protein
VTLAYIATSIKVEEDLLAKYKQYFNEDNSTGRKGSFGDNNDDIGLHCNLNKSGRRLSSKV